MHENNFSYKFMDLNFLTYNVAGLKNKIIFPGFWKFIYAYDIFFLHETHVVENDILNFGRYFGDFNLCWVNAIRSATHGRAKGGSLFGVKKSCKFSQIATFRYINNTVVLCLNMNGSDIYIIPTYLNCNNWETDFFMLTECVETLRVEKLIILGDLNVRIGEEQELAPEFGTMNYNLTTNRRSKDKTVNSRGKKFVEFCNDHGLIILNGRAPGDLIGEFTFIGTMGASVNDVVAVSHTLSFNVKKLSIKNQPYSDHLPVEIVCSINDEVSVREKDMRLLPKLQWKRQNPDQYRSRLQLGLRELPTDASVNDLVNIIGKSSVRTDASHYTAYKNKWFDTQCYKARKKSFKWLNLYRKHNTDFEKKMYLMENKNFRDLCRKKKQAYFEELSYKLGSSRDTKEFWSLVREIRGNKFTTGVDISISDLKNHFEGLLNRPRSAKAILYAAPYISIEELDRQISIGELEAVLRKSKDNKAPGPDRNPYEFFKYALVDFLNTLTKAYNDILDSGKVPNRFLNSIVFPIFKKGDPNLPENYRGLSFMDAVAKLLAGIVNNRLILWEQNHGILKEAQAGFRLGYSTTDNIFNLCNIVKVKLARRGKKVYAFFVDFKAAFDTIDRSALFYKLYNIGVSTKLIRFLQELYKNTSAQVWNGDALSEKFFTSTGLRQGCILSPLLFSLFINDIDDNMSGGVNIDGFIIKNLLYADDLVLLAEDPVELQTMINQLEEYCQTWNLVININKSQIMIFQKGGGRRASSENWIYNGANIDVVNKYKYLGIMLTSRLCMKEHMTERLNAAKATLNSTWNCFIRNAHISHSSKFKLFSAVSRSVMCYGAQVWGFSEYEEVEKLQRFFIKKLFLLPRTTPNYALTLETGLANLYMYTLKCHFSYLLRVLGTYSESRFPYILATKAVEKKIYWYQEWLDLAEKHDLEIRISGRNTEHLSEVLTKILEREERWLWQKAQDRATQTVRHGLYERLNYNPDELTYFRDDFSITKIRIILIYRCGMLQLNASPWRTEGTSTCSLCNMQEDEDLLHYLAICPILKEFRVIAFGKGILTESDVIEILNGRNFDALVTYAKLAWKYRKMLTDEYNY